MNDTVATQALIDECHRQSEACGNTFVIFIIWLRYLRWWRTICNVAPVLFGAVAAWIIVKQSAPALATVCTFLATGIPPIYRASNTDKAIADYEALTGEFTNLRDRFRQAATVSSNLPFAEFQAITESYFDRLEKARQPALSPPEWVFKCAQKKLKKGDYDYNYDRTRVTARPPQP